jgi:hypothetical protein
MKRSIIGFLLLCSVVRADIINLPRMRSINQAITALGTTANRTVVVSNSHTLTANLTVPANIKVVMEKGGSILHASTYIMTFKGKFEAGPYRVFLGFDSSNVTFDSSSVDCIRPEWFGLNVNATAASNATALQAAITTTLRSHTGTVEIGPGVFTYSHVLKIEPDYGIDHGVDICGSGKRTTTLLYSGLEHKAVFIGDSTLAGSVNGWPDWGSLNDIEIHTHNTTADTLIQIWFAHRGYFKNVYISAHDNHLGSLGLYSKYAFQNSMVGCLVTGTRRGVYLEYYSNDWEFTSTSVGATDVAMTLKEINNFRIEGGQFSTQEGSVSAALGMGTGLRLVGTSTTMTIGGTIDAVDFEGNNIDLDAGPTDSTSFGVWDKDGNTRGVYAINVLGVNFADSVHVGTSNALLFSGCHFRRPIRMDSSVNTIFVGCWLNGNPYSYIASTRTYMPVFIGHLETNALDRWSYRPVQIDQGAVLWGYKSAGMTRASLYNGLDGNALYCSGLFKGIGGLWTKSVAHAVTNADIATEPYAGMMLHDSSNDRLYIYNGAKWTYIDLTVP